MKKKTTKKISVAEKLLGGFIEFELRANIKAGAVVCFSNQPFTPHAVRISDASQLPATWYEGYQWEDLTIMFVACPRSPRERDYNWKERLFSFIHAFGFKKGEAIYMDIFKSRLPVPS